MIATFKTFTLLLAFGIDATVALSQGEISFRNNSSTMILAEGVPMPVSGVQQFNFALFLAPSTTVNAPGLTPSLTHPNFQFADAYQTNHPSIRGILGPLPTRVVGASQGFGVGSTVDFVVRGWSANAGATWAEALATWNNGSPLLAMYIGSSTVGNNFMLGGGAGPTPVLFGFQPDQIQGFNMVFIPEPSTVSFGFLGLFLLWLRARFRRGPHPSLNRDVDAKCQKNQLFRTSASYQRRSA